MARHIPSLGLAAAATAGLALVIALAQLAPQPANAVFEDADGDGAIDVMEQISGSNPNNGGSVPEDGVVDFLTGGLGCSDFADNDGDGLTDGFDNGCVDHDGDVVSDAMEMLLGSDPFDDNSFPEDSRFDATLAFLNLPALTCSDDEDNDGDGQTDEADSGCVVFSSDSDDFDDLTEKSFGSDPEDANSVPEHENPNPGACSDGMDNDLDGLTDGADPACVTPANDDRADATVIGAVPFSDGPSAIKNATREPGEPRSNCGLGSQTATVWYTITPLADQVLVVDTIGSTFSNSLSIWQRTGSTLTLVTCDANATGASRVVFRAAAGEQYFFQIDAPVSFGRELELALNVTLGSPPANDDFLNAATIGALPFTDNLDKSDATSEFGEPRPPCGYYTGSPSVWYTFTPGSDTLVVADTFGSQVDTVVGVYIETIFGLGPVACSDDFGELPQSKLAFEALSGKTYFFQVARAPSFFGAGSNFDVTFHADVGVPPSNDDFADATPLTLPFSEDIDLLTAGLEPDESVPGCLDFYTVSSSVWYSFTAPSNTFIVASAGEPFSSGNSYFGVYQGSSLDDLAPVACGGPNYPMTRVGFAATGGQTYYLQIGALTYSGGFGDGLGAPAGAAPAGSSQGQPLAVEIESEPLPTCPAPEFTVPDRVGDPFGFSNDPTLPDITSVTGGSNSQSFCLTLHLNDSFDPPGTGSNHEAAISAFFDTDRNFNTGFREGPCSSGMGLETTARSDGLAGQLVDVYDFFKPQLDVYGIAQYNGSTITLIVPLQAIGGDDSFAFSAGVGEFAYSERDCVPDRGGILSPVPAEPGDANCDGSVDGVDALLAIQYFLRMTPALPCQNVADVNQNGNIGPLDALQILQYAAGLIDEFVPEG